MPHYIVTRKSDGAEATRYASSAVALLDEYPPDAFDHVEWFPDGDGPPDTRMYGGRRRLTKLEFVALFGQTAYAAILTAAKTEIMIEAWVKMIDLAAPDADGTSVDLDDPRTQYGVSAIGAALQQMGVVDGAWAATVLAG